MSTPYPKLLQGKTGLVMGIANEWSLAWGIAEAAHAAGAKLIVTYANAAMEKRVRPLAEKLSAEVHPCDVQADSQLSALAKTLEGTTLDFMVHAVAFAHKDELKGGITNTTREGFNLALDVSCYSLIALMKAMAPLLAPAASVVTLSYEGSTKVVPNYNVMGVAKAALEAAVRYLAAEFGPKGTRVNALSAGPVNTLAARGIADFQAMLKHHEKTAPLARLTTQQDVAGAALYLLSSLSSGTTGEVHFVDTGAHILGPTPFADRGL
ncbi:MAG: SDR family oxidoreductase [Proteobacteria bacterium]|nr:SDR family oxidoreductase [Pseudomonadota bacterium]